MSTAVLVAFLCVSSVVALTSACCTPAQWEGQLSAMGGFANAHTHTLITEFNMVSYDAINNRTASVLFATSGDVVRKMKILILYDNHTGIGKQYVLDYIKDTCFTFTVKTPFRKICVPDDAKPVGNFSLGLSAMNITGYEIPSKELRNFMSVEQLGNNECVPVSESHIGKAQGADIIMSVAFFNITSGIKNETVFDVPEKCQKMNDLNLAENVFRRHYIMAF